MGVTTTLLFSLAIALLSCTMTTDKDRRPPTGQRQPMVVELKLRDHGVDPPQTRPASREGDGSPLTSGSTIIVTLDRPGERIVIDGQVVAVSTDRARISSLKAGKHTIEVFGSDERYFNQIISTSAGATVEVFARLKPQPRTKSPRQASGTHKRKKRRADKPTQPAATKRQTKPRSPKRPDRDDEPINPFEP